MDQEAIRNQIDRILKSGTFADKHQLRKLLDLLSTNLDSQRTLRPDRICRELWPEKNGSKGPADVAVEMHRLRQALESYYNGEGRNDPTIITLPSRATPAVNGMKDRRWITAESRVLTCDPPVSSLEQFTAQDQPRRSGAKLRFIAIIAGAAAAAILAGAFIRSATTDDRPHAARLDGLSLAVANAAGKELWRKGFPDGFWPEYYSGGLASFVWFGDLTGDGHTEILFLYHPAVDPLSHSTTLICYSDKGEEKWRWIPGRVLPELQNEPATFLSNWLAVLKPANRMAARIVVASNHIPRYPSQIALIDSYGKTISEYWHSGHLDYLALADLDDDGRQEIIASGVANGYHQAVLVVLDADRISGASSETAQPRFQLHGMGAAHERFRLLFPRSDLNRETEEYNAGGEIAVANGAIRVSVLECNLNPYCQVWYGFDRSFTLRSLHVDDRFKDAHREYYRNARNSHSFTPEELKEFQKVRCLVGCGTEFVPVDIH